MSRPSMRIAPVSTSWNRASSDASVDLPEPDGPTSAVTVPGRSVSVTSWMTGNAGTVTEADVRRRRPCPARPGLLRSRVSPRDQFVLVEGDGDAAGGLHALTESAEAEGDAQQASAERGSENQERQQSGRLHRPVR